MNKYILFAGAAVAMGVAMAPAAQAQTVYNGCPTTAFQYGGGGNDYTPCNALVQTFVNGGDTVELASRWHVTGQTAPTSAGRTYLFALGSSPISFDFGVEANYNLAKAGNVTFSVTNLSTHENHTYDARSLPDNYTGGQDTLLQNSERLNFGFLFGPHFDANTDVTYRLDLSVNGDTSTTFARIGAGTVPEPATWAMFILGFGAIGGALRRRKQVATGVRYA